MRIGRVFILGILLSGLTACWVTANGQKSGILVKFSKEGVIFKTYEAELIRGGFNSGSGVNGASFHFTIEKPELITKMQKAFEGQSEVIITYHEEAITGCWRGESKLFLDNITIKGEKE